MLLTQVECVSGVILTQNQLLCRWMYPYALVGDAHAWLSELRDLHIVTATTLLDTDERAALEHVIQKETYALENHQTTDAGYGHYLVRQTIPYVAVTPDNFSSYLHHIMMEPFSTNYLPKGQDVSCLEDVDIEPSFFFDTDSYEPQIWAVPDLPLTPCLSHPGDFIRAIPTNRHAVKTRYEVAARMRGVWSSPMASHSSRRMIV